MKSKRICKIISQEQIGTGIFSMWLESGGDRGGGLPGAVCISVQPG